jgi:hypothetical protein
MSATISTMKPLLLSALLIVSCSHTSVVAGTSKSGQPVMVYSEYHFVWPWDLTGGVLSLFGL